MENAFNRQSNKIKGGNKMSKRLHIYGMLLLATLFFITGCGGSGEKTLSVEEKTAKVSLSFQFPDEEAEKSVISNATTHILINAWQWKKRKDGTIYQINFERKLIDKATTSTTLDLFPAYTNICATQWQGDPNQILTSRKLETICSFGILQPGTNNVTLRMIRGNWTLSSPFAFNNTTSLISFSLYRKGYPLYEYETQQGLNDITYNDFFGRGMAKFNYGSEYNVALKATKTYYGSNGYYNPPYMFDQPSLSIGYYSNFFNTGDAAPAIFIGKDETKQPLIPKGYVLFGLPKKTDSDGWFGQKKEFIEPIDYDYNTHNLALVERAVEIRIDKWGGTSYNNNQTAAILDPCVPNTVSANTMTLCAAKEDSIELPVTSFNQYSGLPNSYKVTFRGIVSGANICYDQGSQPILDPSGNVVGCYDFYASINYNPTAATQCLSGTWNSTNNRCELTFQEACSQIGGTWDGSGCSLNNGSYYYGSSICYSTPAGPNMWNQPLSSSSACYNGGIRGTIQCYNGGTYQNFRCEKDLQTSCYGGSTPDPGVVYNPTTKTCSFTEVNYIGAINFTPLTATGVGKFESEVNFGASKVTEKTAKFKLNIPKK